MAENKIPRLSIRARSYSCFTEESHRAILGPNPGIHLQSSYPGKETRALLGAGEVWRKEKKRKTTTKYYFHSCRK